MKAFQKERLMAALNDVRKADSTVCPFMTPSALLWQSHGIITGYFYAGLVDAIEFGRLIDLNNNAYLNRTDELRKAA